MIKRILMTSALCGLMASTALAQAQTQTPQAGSQMQSGSSGAAMGGGDFIATQDQKHWLADDLIGTTVKNADDEIGDIDNLVLDEDGKLVGVVISVGEFLGIGGKSVAVAFDKLKISADPNNPDSYLVNVEYTKEQLEQAPPFKTLEDAQSEAQRQAPASGAPAGGGMGTTTPATPRTN